MSTGIVDDYVERGYVVVRGAVDPATVAAALDHLAELRDRSGAAPEAPLLTAPVEREPFFQAIAADPGLAGVASALVGGEANAFGCTYLVKPPRTGLPVLWHQDGEPWRARLGITEAVTLWLALVPATIDNGCLRVIPRSHRHGAQPLQPSTAIPNVFGVASDPSLVDERLAVAVPMAAGDVSAHHPALLHGSDANRSDTARAALAIRYRGPALRS